MSDRWNSKWRPPPSWIYYFCPFWSIGLFPVAACYITAKFHSSTSIGGWVIDIAAIMNYNFVMLDHPRSPFVHLKFPFKFRVDRVRTFRDIAIRKLRKFGLKCLFGPPKIRFLGSFDPQTLFFIIETPKRPYLTWTHAFCAINGRDRSSGVTCRRGQAYKKRMEHKK